jgi:hypothetical protein
MMLGVTKSLAAAMQGCRVVAVTVRNLKVTNTVQRHTCILPTSAIDILKFGSRGFWSFPLDRPFLSQFLSTNLLVTQVHNICSTSPPPSSKMDTAIDLSDPRKALDLANIRFQLM